MGSTNTAKVSESDWSFLNISDVDPKQLYHKVETTINGVTKKILVPVMKSQLDQKNSSAAQSSPPVESSLPKEPEPITIVPLEDSESQSGLQISNVTSLKPFMEKQASDSNKQVGSTAVAVAKGRGRGRGRKPKNVHNRHNGQPARTKSCKAGTVSMESNDTRQLNDPSVLKDIIFALMSERIGFQKDMISPAGKQNAPNIILEHSELPAHQGKMLIHVGQNPDGSHMYKTYDIATTKNNGPCASSNTHVATTVMSNQSVYSTASLPIQNSPSLATGQQVQNLGNTHVATANNLLNNTVRPPGNVPATNRPNVIIMESDVVQKGVINQSVLPGHGSSATLNAMPSAVNSQVNCFLSNYPAGTRVIPVTKHTATAGSGLTQLPLFPVAGQGNAGPQGSFQTLSPGSLQMTSQSAQNKPVASQNIANSTVLSTNKGNAVLIGPVVIANKQLTGSCLQLLSPVRTDAPNINSQIPGGAVSVVQNKNALCNSSAYSGVISSSSTAVCQQPAIVTGYLNGNGQIVIQAPAMLPQNAQSQPMVVKTAALLPSPSTQPKFTIVSTAGQSLTAATCNSVDPGRPNQLNQPVVLQKSPTLPNLGVPPTGVVNLGVTMPNQDSASVRQNPLNRPLILQGGTVVANQVMQPPAGAQTQNNILNSIYSTASVSLVASHSTTVVSSQTSNAAVGNPETSNAGPRFGQLQMNATEAITLRIGDVDVATLLNIARCGGVKDAIQLQNYVLESKNAASEKKKSPGRESIGDKITRRHTDINVGRERTIYPKTTEVLTVSTNPVRIIPLYNNDSDNGKTCQNIPDIEAIRPDLNGLGKSVAKDRSDAAYCSIVNLMKQDLALVEKDRSSKSPLVSEPHLIKPCKVVIEKLNLGSQTSVNLKRCKLFWESSSGTAKRSKNRRSNVGKKRQSVTRRRRSRRVN